MIGAGLEYAFTNNISAKAEYLYAPLDEPNLRRRKRATWTCL